MAVTWAVEGDGGEEHLLLDWVEQDGPPVAPPTRRGFGSTLIERALEHDLHGQAKIEFRPEGVRASIRVPLRNETGQPALSVRRQE